MAKALTRFGAHIVCIVALILILVSADAQYVQARHAKPKPTPTVQVHPPIRHYMGGCTRTTQYDLVGWTAGGVWVYYGELAADYSLGYGTHVVIPGLGTFKVEDRGPAVYGNHLDLWVPYVGYAPPGGHSVNDCYWNVYWYT